MIAQSRFRVTHGPKVSVFSDFALYDGFQGISSENPSSVRPYWIGDTQILIEDPTGIASAELIAPDQTYAISGGVKVKSGTITHPIPAGQYTVRATNLNGVTTVAPFIVAAMDVKIDFKDPNTFSTWVLAPGSNPCFDAKFVFPSQSSLITLDLSASLGLADLTCLDPQTGGVIGCLGPGGSPLVPLFGNSGAITLLVPTTQGISLLLTDSDGNSYNFAAIPFGQEPSNFCEWSAQTGNQFFQGTYEYSFSGPIAGRQFVKGSFTNASLGGGVTVSGVGFTGEIHMAVGSGFNPPPGWQIAAHQTYSISDQLGIEAGGPPVPLGLQLSLPVPTNGLTNRQVQFARFVSLGPTNEIKSQSPGNSANVVVPGRFAIVVPSMTNPILLNLYDPAELLYDGDGGQTLALNAVDTTTAQFSTLIAQAQSQGLVQDGEFVQVTGADSLKRTAYLTMTAIGDPTDAVYMFLSSGTPVQLSGLYRNYSKGQNATVTLSSANAYFGVFKRRRGPDVMPPRSSLSIGDPSFSSSSVYATALTTFSIAAIDDRKVFGDGFGDGVAQTYLAIDTTAFSLYSGTFSLSTEGLHLLSFYSVDVDSHTEAVETSTIAVDLTPPISSLQVLGSATTDSFGDLIISSSTALTLSAADPLSNGVASGVSQTFYVIDSSPASSACQAVPADPTQPPGTCANEAYAGPFTLSVGTHTVYYLSEDNVVNQEAVNVASITVLAPQPQAPVVVVNQTPLPAPAAGAGATPLGNYIYTSIPSTGKVVRTTPEGTVLSSISGFGPAGPGLIASNGAEGVLAHDPSNGRIMRFDPAGNMIAATPAAFQSVSGIAAFAAQGDYFAVADETASAVTVWNPDGTPAGVTLPAGTGPGQVLKPRGLSTDQAGNLYVVDAGNGRVQVLTVNWDDVFNLGANLIVSTSSQFGAGLSDPAQIAVGPDGAVYVSDRLDHAIHVFSPGGAPKGVIGGFGQGALDFLSVQSLSFDPAGRLYVADGSRRLAVTAGNPPSGPPPALGPLTIDSVSPWAINVTVDAPQPAAALYEFRVSQSPIQSDADFANAVPVAMPGPPSTAPATVDLLHAGGLSPNTTYYLALKAIDFSGRASNMATGQAATAGSVPKGTLVTVAGNTGFEWLGDGWAGTLGAFGAPRAVVSDPAGNIYIADGDGLWDFFNASRIRKVDAVTRVMTTLGGGPNGFAGDGGPVSQARFFDPRGLAVDAQGNLYVSDTQNREIRKIDAATGVITRYAGNGQPGYGGDGGPAVSARIQGPKEIALDYYGNLYIADGTHRVRRVDAKTGIITTVAGNGQAGNSGDGGPATQARIDTDFGLAMTLDAMGNLYIAEASANRVRKVDGRTGIITTVAGNGAPTTSGDGGPATAASLSSPIGLAIDPIGNLYIAEAGTIGINAAATAGNVVRRVDAKTGIITTVAGNGQFDTSGGEGPALSAGLATPVGMYLDAGGGALYVSDLNNHRIAALGLDPFQVSRSTVLVGGQPEAIVQSTGSFMLTAVSSTSQSGAIASPAAARQGLTAISDIFLISPSSAPGAPLALSFVFDPTGIDTTTISLYHFNGVSWSSAAVVAQAMQPLSGGLWRATGIAELASPFGVFAYHLDHTPPISFLSVGQPQLAVSSGVIVSSVTLMIVVSTDPVVDGFASGVKDSFLSIDDASFAATSSSFSISTEGWHSVAIYSRDNVLNVEAVKISSVGVDRTPPATALAIGLPQFAASTTTLFVSALTTFGLSAVDPMSAGLASGLRQTLFAVSASSFAVYSGTFSLSGADGGRTIQFYSVDDVGNTEILKSTTVILDQTPPITTARVGLSSYTASNGALYVTPATPVTFTAVDPSSGTPASGVAQIQVAIDTGSFMVYAATLTFAEGTHTVLYRAIDNVGNVEAAHALALNSDATPPVTSLLPSGAFYASAGQDFAPATFSYALTAQDPVSSGVASGVAFTSFRVSPASFAYYASSFSLTEGVQRVDFQSQDNVGNLELLKSATIYVDATPPISALVIGQPQFALSSTTLLVSSRTPFGLSAIDPVVSAVASGVKDTWYSVADLAPSTGPFQVFAASFTMAGLDVNKAISFYSRDNVLNAEIVKSSTVLLDSTPPEISLLSPAACDSGICRVVKGRFPVLGTAKDLHFSSYVLDSAPGQNATAGFAAISSAAVVVSSGALGVWDTRQLSGWQTLRLTASDLVQNVSVLSINVWVGDPAGLMVLGNHEVLSLPTGVAVSSGGAIYVADRDNDRVAVFSSTGTPLASFGGRHDDDDHKVSTATLRLSKPSAVAVDASGNVYVADTNDNRVLKLSPAGAVLLEIGRRKRKIEHDDDHREVESEPGKTPGQFNKPSGIAVDAAGDIYVADTENGRVQAFSSTGAFVLQFTLPTIPRRGEDDDRRKEPREKGDDDHEAELGKPAGLALDAAGRVYVADPRGHRALVYGTTGQLLLTIPIPGDRPERAGRPVGVAVSTSGDCLLVSDQASARVLKFDFTGAQNLVFGGKGREDDDGRKRAVAGIVFRKPSGLALDAAGNLYVADRNNDRIKKFGLPSGQPMLVVPPAKPEDEDAAREVVESDEGGQVRRKDGAGIAVPAAALPDDLKISVATASAASLGQASARDAAIQAQSIMPAYAPVEYQPEGTQFAKPVTLTLPYDPSLLASLNVSPDSLQVQYWNPKARQWQAFDSTVDPDRHTVTAKTTHFSLYQVMIGSAAVQAMRPQAASSTVDTIQAACNPLRPGCQPLNFRNLPAGARLRIYTLTGALVKDMPADGSGLASWDGTNQSGQPAASGVYFVFAQGNGTTKTIKIAVER